MQQRRWLNQSQPQTLQIAVLLFYLDAGFTALFLVMANAFPPIYLLAIVGQIAAAYGIANEYKWGYALGVAMVFFPFFLRLAILGNPLRGAGLLQLMFEIALVALLLHPHSRDYQRLWFK